MGRRTKGILQEQKDYSKLLLELQGQRTPAPQPKKTVAASAQKTQYSPYRQRIMSNKAVNFIYAKNKGQLHDKSCPEVQKIPDEELCCSGKYLSNISHSNVSVVR